MTTTEDGQLTVFAAMDHRPAERGGIHIVRRATRFEALEPIRQGIREHFGGFRAEVAAGLELRHDHGFRLMIDDFHNEIRFLGIESSPAFAREPEVNGVAEWFITTLREQMLWPCHFHSLLETRETLGAFRNRYDRQSLIERLGFQAPSQARRRLALKSAA